MVAAEMVWNGFSVRYEADSVAELQALVAADPFAARPACVTPPAEAGVAVLDAIESAMEAGVSVYGPPPPPVESDDPPAFVVGG